ncbi:MAG: GIY-YIG nuclease family protein [Alphaproteobacteria bacterium]|nr:GIY-YIG nuclease family protein [Alphaproteobacteria bacterium]
MRQQILDAIRRLGAENSGKTPSARLFERETGIREGAWRGVYWARWGDAVREAGLEPNAKQGKLDEQFLLAKLAEACRHFRKFQTAMELRLYQKQDTEFPNVKTFRNHFGSLANIPGRLAAWATTNGNNEDLLSILGASPGDPNKIPSTATKEGLVYLIRSGGHCKIGRSDELERRVKEIRIALPESAALVHSIRTDDPAGIEAYWHRCFANRRANGEWFKLTTSDIAAFKRRRFQ